MFSEPSTFCYPTFDYLTDVCRIAADGRADDLIEICNRCDIERQGAPQGLSRILIEPWLKEHDIYRSEKNSSLLTALLADALREDGFRRRFRDLVTHYQEVHYHAVYIRHGQHPNTFGDVPFLARYFGALDKVASTTLDIYFRKADLLLHKSTRIGIRAGTHGHWPGTAWGAVVAQSRAKNAATRISELREDALAVWDNDFRPEIVPMGRFDPTARVGVIATLVTALQRGDTLKKAATFAQNHPLDSDILLPPPRTQPYRQEVEGWRKELLARHAKYPDRGYDEVERTLALLLSPSLPARIYGNARLRMMATIVAGAIAATGSAETIINVPEAWSTVAHWVTDSSHSPPKIGHETGGPTTPGRGQESCQPEP